MVAEDAMEPLEALLVVLAVAVAFALLYLVGRHEVVRRKLTCPRTGVTANVDVVQRYHEPTQPVRVRSCDLLPDPKKVDCSQDCLAQQA